MLKESILNIFQSKMNDAFKGAVEELYDGVFVVVLSVDLTKYACEDAGILYGTVVQEALNTYTNVSISFSISNRIRDIRQIPKSVDDTLQALQHKVFYGCNCMITYKQSKEFKKEINCSFSCNEDKIRYYVLNSQIESVKVIITDVFKNIEKNTGSFIQLNYICTQYVSILNKISIELGFSRENQKSIFAVEDPLRLESIFEIEDWFKNQFELLCQSIGSNKNCCTSGMIREAMKYIRMNYMNDITLQDVAEHINISRIYFSQLFRQETGEKYIDFLNKIRIEKAKEYLTFHDLKTYEVAEKVGFQDGGYFARIFKKHVGETPSEYQKEVTSVQF
jgi:two-component system response regulator YesN